MPRDFLDVLGEWEQAKSAAASWTAREKELRSLLFNAAFDNPVEGVNALQLVNGRILKGTYKVTRTVDQDRVEQVAEEIRRISNAVDTEKLFPKKYGLGLKAYYSLPEEVRAVVDRVVSSKLGSPVLELV